MLVVLIKHLTGHWTCTRLIYSNAARRKGGAHLRRGAFHQLGWYRHLSRRKRYGMCMTCFAGRLLTVLQSASNMETFILCMLLYPYIQKRAQAELDSVIVSDRLATLADRSQLPYIEAWGLVVPEGLAHTARNDAVYDGHLIPKGTVYLMFGSYRPATLDFILMGSQGLFKRSLGLCQSLCLSS